jgi:hypothetical protein
MTSMTTDEMADRIVRSLKDNSAELAKEQRLAERGKKRQIGFVCLIFVVGIAAGALLLAVFQTNIRL